MWKSLTKVNNQKILLSFNFWRFAITFLKSLFVEIMLGVFFCSILGIGSRSDWSPIWIRFCIRMYLDPKHSEPNFLASAGAKTYFYNH